MKNDLRHLTPTRKMYNINVSIDRKKHRPCQGQANPNSNITFQCSFRKNISLCSMKDS